MQSSVEEAGAAVADTDFGKGLSVPRATPAKKTLRPRNSLAACWARLERNTTRRERRRRQAMTWTFDRSIRQTREAGGRRQETGEKLAVTYRFVEDNGRRTPGREVGHRGQTRMDVYPLSFHAVVFVPVPTDVVMFVDDLQERSHDDETPVLMSGHQRWRT